ncbi:hypothetical protein M5689_011092 [Euphorbia peplus]|nr:hypothetical protein M5689_011092 [Euphorbia peplus]
MRGRRDALRGSPPAYERHAAKATFGNIGKFRHVGTQHRNPSSPDSSNSPSGRRARSSMREHEACKP